MSSTITTSMSLIIPGVGSEPGPTYASDINASLTLIDAHNHSPGYGVQITPSGLNISTDLTFAGNQATNLKAILFTNQTSLATVNALYTIGGELWYNDTTNPVQITSAGGVNATSSGISSGTATASFSGSGPYTLVVNSAANTPANIQAGSILIGNNSALSKFLTLQPPNAMASNYSVTLPPLASGTQYMTFSTSGSTGTMASVATIPGSAITSASITTTQIASATILTGNIASATILTGNIAANTLLRSNMAPPAISLSSSCGSFSNSGSSQVDITNLTTTFTLSSTTKSVMMQIMADGTASPSYMTGNGASIYFYCNGASQGVYQIADNSDILGVIMKLPSSLSQIVSPIATTSITYKIRVNPNGNGFTMNNAVLRVWEI